MTGPGSALRPGLDRRTRRRALTLSAVTGATALFGLIDYDPLKLVPVNPVQAVVLLVLALIGFAGTMLGSRPILFGVGAVMIALGLIRLVTYGQAFGLIAGSVGTAALLTGLGMAFIGSMLVGDKPTPERRPTPIGPD
ncbi:hypothetical protein [Arthrobacter sp. AL12]|uniref:Rv1678 family membrane protein n=1 Tax=Arthrobacter sp. AL12 TaxID=3042241 RepID=UPI002499AD17|nr:hypothetical protein [Arthrobacter sp. AL12]MDI3212529.1 hypothetical protein [Arthrobacter sp. AL12]